MKPFHLIALLCVSLSFAPAAEWPRAFEVLEEAVVKEPVSGNATNNLFNYVRSADRFDELAQRWGQRTAGSDGTAYRVLLGRLAMARQKLDEAKAILEQAAAVAPASPLPWLALGDLEKRQERDPIPAWQKGAELELAGKEAGRTVTALGRFLTRKGRAEEAVALYERSAPFTKDGPARKSHRIAWAEAAFKAGKLGDLIARFEKAGAAGEVKASADLVAVYLAMNDTSMAEQVLAEAQQRTPGAAEWKECALSVARATNNYPEQARLLREEARASAATPEDWWALFFLLAQEEKTAEIRELFAQHGREIILGAPSFSKSQVRLLGLEQPMISLLERYEREAGWKGIVARYELRAEKKPTENSVALLWKLFGRDFEDRPLSPSVLTQTIMDRSDSYSRFIAPYSVGAFEGAGWRTRRQQIRSRSDYPSSMGSAPLSSLQASRDWALWELASEVNGTERAAAFPEKLAAVIKDFPLGERIFAWSVVENLEHLVAEIGAYVDAGRGDAGLDEFCSDQLKRVLNAPGLGLELSGRVRELLAGLPPVPPGEPSPEGLMRRDIQTAISRGSLPAVVDLVEQAIERFPAERDSWLMTFQGAGLQSMRYSPPGKNPVADFLNVVRGFSLMEAAERRLPGPGDEAALLSSRSPLSRFGPPFNRPEMMGRPGPGPGMRGPNQPSAFQPVFPPREVIASEAVSGLWQEFAKVRGGSFPKVEEGLEKMTGLSPERAFFVRVMAAYFEWWNDEPVKAVERMKALVAETGSDQLRLSLASMLIQTKQGREADELIQQVALPYPAYRRFVTFWRLRAAVQTRDLPAATSLARELENVPLPPDRLREMADLFDLIDRREDATALRLKVIYALPAPQSASELNTAFTEYPKAGLKGQALLLALARNILAESPKAAERSASKNSLRSKAWEVLGKAGAGPDYKAEVESKAMASEASLDDLLRFAEVTSEPGKTEAAWNKVLELDPKNVRALEWNKNRAIFGAEESLESFEARFAANPTETFQNQGRQMLEKYEKQQQLPRFAALIAHSRFEPRDRETGSGFTDSSTLVSLARKLNEAGDRETALTILRKGMEVSAGHGDIEGELIDTLVAVGRKEEAGGVLADAYFPASTAGVPVLALSWKQPAVANDRDLDLLFASERLGIAAELRRRADAAFAQSSGVEEKTPGTKGESMAAEVRLVLRCLAHEPEVLPELEARVDSLSTKSENRWIQSLLKPLISWPEAQPIAKKVFEAYAKTLERGNPQSRTYQQLALARIAAEGGSAALASAAARSALDSMSEDEQMTWRMNQISQVAAIASQAQDNALLALCGQRTLRLLETVEANQFVNQEDLLKLFELLTKAGCKPEQVALGQHLRKLAGTSGNRDLGTWFELMDVREELERGELLHAGPIVWMDGQHSTAEKTWVVWDVGRLRDPRYYDGGTISPGENFPALDGRFDVELLFGVQEGAMSTLAHFPKASARGIWQGPLPAARGFVRAIFSDGNHFYFSEPAAVATGTDVFSGVAVNEPAPTPAVDAVKSFAGGPQPGGSFLSFPSVARAPNSNSNPETVLHRVELKSGQDYVFATWVRTRDKSYLTFLIRFYDRDGKRVGEQQIFQTRDQGDFWTYRTRRLQSARRDLNGSDLSIPARAVFAEPVLQRSSGGLDLAAFSLVEIPPVKKEEANEEDP